MLAATLIALAVLAALALLLLAVPVELAFQFAGHPAPVGQVTIGWLFGLVRVPVSVGPGAGAPARGKRPSKPRSPAGRRLPLRDLWRQKAFRRRVWRFVRDLIGSVRVRQLRLRLRWGLDDPADTGRLWAVAGPLALMLPWRGADLQIRPDFEQAVLDWDVQGRLLFVPLQWVGLVLFFVLSPASIRTWRILRSGHG